ncbi:PadR family transcriptional regulator [Nocardioidaceae bacterium]|nr:PadR family transcriptional regulator [Nocardioidaceae bacterium]
MALEHALLVSLQERPAAGLELTRRFEKSIGLFWQARHQQIYRVLARMEADGWITAETVAQRGRPDKRVYSLTADGREALAEWIATPSETEPMRSDLAVKMRGAAYGDREALLDHVAETRAEHAARLRSYESMSLRDYPDPDALEGADLDRYLVLRGGVRLERFWVDWLDEYLEAWQRVSPEKKDTA